MSAADEFFASNPAPKSLARHEALAKEFIQYHVESSASRRIVLVTSGGTTVPLENQTVRFIDNFSAGTRGATSAEYFLKAGYAVIFLHRQFSLLPYSRHYSHSTNCFLDFMDVSDKGIVIVADEYQEKMKRVLGEYNYAKKNRLLLILPFTTVTEYLFELRALAVLMQPLGTRALFYLAAAVSDFFIPRERMEEHKIQSRDIDGSGGVATAGTDASESASADAGAGAGTSTGTGTGTGTGAGTGAGRQLLINLDPVPKFLNTLVSSWAPKGSMIVSFKLETDPSLLVGKATYALERYQHDLVIGNLLTTRKWEVVFITANGGEHWIRVPKARRSKSLTGNEKMVGLADLKQQRAPEPVDLDGGTVTEGMEIESLIIPELKALHDQMIDDALAQSSSSNGQS